MAHRLVSMYGLKHLLLLPVLVTPLFIVTSAVTSACGAPEGTADSHVWLNSAEFSPDGKQVLAGCSDGSIRIWNVKSRTEVAQWQGHSRGVQTAVFSPDGKQILTCGSDQSARVWESDTKKEVRRLIGLPNPVTAAVFSPDGRRLLTSAGSSAQVWESKTGQKLAELSGHEGGVFFAVYSHNGRQILTGSGDGTARLWEANRGTQLRRLDVGVWVTQGAFSLDDQRVVISDREGAAIWRLAKERVERVLKGHKDYLTSVAVSPKGRLVVTGSQDEAGRLWELGSGKEVRRWEDAGEIVRGQRFTWGPIVSTRFSPDGKFLLTATAGNVRVWDLRKTGQPLLLPYPGWKPE